MSWLTLTIAIFLTGAVIGFFGLAVLSSLAGQYFLAVLAGAIFTYWTALAGQSRASTLLKYPD